MVQAIGNRQRVKSTLVVLVLATIASSCGSEGVVTTSPTPSATAQASLDNAQWSGRWEFKYTLTRMEGVEQAESPFTLGSQIRRVWDITPGCPEGPCNAEIVGTDPDDPSSGEVRSVVTYDNGSYRISQTFPPEPQQGCTGSDGKSVPGAFEATNVVTAKPTDFELDDGKVVVTALSSTKVTTFRPTGKAAQAGGSCTVKTATWEGTAIPLPS